MARKTNKKPGKGRPPKYKREYCRKLIDFFDIEPYSQVELEHYKGKGEDRLLVWTDIKRMANRLPTLRNFAKSIGVSYVSVYAWIKKYPDFLNAFTHAQELRKWFLIENGLNGCYNPQFAVFTAKNITDMKDTHELGGHLSLAVAIHEALGKSGRSPKK